MAKKDLQTELEKFLIKVCSDDGLDPTFEQDVPMILQKFNENGPLTVSFDWMGNVQDHYEGTTECVYYSKAIKHTICLNYDGYPEFKDIKDMAKWLIKLETQAIELEARLKTIK